MSISPAPRSRLRIFAVRGALLLCALVVTVWLSFREKRLPAHELHQSPPPLSDTRPDPAPLPPEPAAPAPPAQGPALDPRIAARNQVAKGFNQGIEFWGRVLDQDGVPMEGVSVPLVTPSMVMLPDGSYDWGGEILKTDAQGYFHMTGSGLNVILRRISKEGYIMEPLWPSDDDMSRAETHTKRNTQETARIYRMWKIGNPEPLCYFSGSMRINLDWSWRPFRSERRPMRQHKGDVLISAREVVVGGKAQTRIGVSVENSQVCLPAKTDRFRFEAPAEGYQEMVEMECGDYTEENNSIEDVFYIYYRDGESFGRCYGVLAVIVDRAFGDNSTFIRIEGRENLGGSRNLEFDPEKPIRARRPDPR